MATPKYRKIGNVIFGCPFKDGTYGMKVVKDYVRTFRCEPTIRMRRLSAKEKFELVR
jgi:hypothetical protein